MKIIFISQPHALLLASGAIREAALRITGAQLSDRPVLIYAALLAKSQKQLLDQLGVKQYNLINQLLKGLPPYYLVRGLALAVAEFSGCRPMQRGDALSTFIPYHPAKHIHRVQSVQLIEPFKLQIRGHGEIQEVKVEDKIKKIDRKQWCQTLFQYTKYFIGV